MDKSMRLKKYLLLLSDALTILMPRRLGCKILNQRSFAVFTNQPIISSYLFPKITFSSINFRSPEHAVEASFAELQRSLQRKRSNAKPQCLSGLKNSYKSIWKFAKHCEEHPEDLKLVDEHGKEHGQLQGKLIKSSSRTYHYLMYDKELMEEFSEGNEVKLDGTFDTRPRVQGVGQLLTIMSKKFNVVSDFHHIKKKLYVC